MVCCRSRTRLPVGIETGRNDIPRRQIGNALADSHHLSSAIRERHNATVGGVKTGLNTQITIIDRRCMDLYRDLSGPRGCRLSGRLSQCAVADRVGV